jgi:hypothetical protein
MGHAMSTHCARWTVHVVCMGLAVLLFVDSVSTVQAFGVVAPSPRAIVNPPRWCALLGAVSERASQNEAAPSVSTPNLEAATVVPVGSAAAAAAPSSDSAAKSVTAIPFVIERVRDNMGQNNMQAYFEISKVCIEAFFNDSNEATSATPFWKSWQLAYLRTLQSADLERRRRREGHSNIMLVARAVEPASLDRNHAHTPL